jgi:VanZ family protein
MLLGTCWLAFEPHPPPVIDTGWDKANHALAFSTLMLVGCRAFVGARRRELVPSLALLAYGVLIELVQAQIPGRDADWHDVVADTVGLAIGSALARPWLRRLSG